MATEAAVRDLALGLSGAVEADHHGRPSFRVGGKIFSTLWTDPSRMMVKLEVEDQHNLCAANPESIEPVPGSWGRGGATFVAYERIDDALAGELLRMAWTRVAPARLRKAASASAGPSPRRLDE